jgi:hypothetical protein
MRVSRNLWGPVAAVAVGLVTGCPLQTFELEGPPMSGGFGGFGGHSSGSGGTPAAGGTEIDFGGAGGQPPMPVLEPDRYAILQGEKLSVLPSNGVLANDFPSDLRVVGWTTADVPDGFEAELDIDEDGGFTFKPARAFFGTYGVEYTAENADGEHEKAAFEIRVVPTGIDLASVEAGVGGFVLHGDAGDALGVSIDGVADIDRDGKGEILIGAPGANSGAGAAYLVHGKDDFESIELTLLPSQTSERRFHSLEGQANDGAGVSVSGLGDVDGDMTGDLVIGANNANDGQGRAYVVFTRGLARASKLPPSEGYTLFGDSSYTDVGRVVAGAGDANGDSVPDVIVSFRSRVQDIRYGLVRVALGSTLVPGQDPRSSLIFNNAGGFSLQSRESEDTFPLAAAGVGDVDDDGYEEVLLASHTSFLLVRGGTTYPELEALEPDGSSGGWSQRRTGARDPASVARAGDVDGDGAEDLAYCDGASYCRVVFGPPTTLGTGWMFAGFAPGATKLLTSGGGDIDGDGYDDPLFADEDFAYAVYGKPTGHSEVNVASLRSAGYRITAHKTGTITALAMLGDVNGDGVSDFAIGDASANDGAGRVYVIFGVFSGLDAGDQ